MEHHPTTLFTFDCAAEAEAFRSIDDRVMGGASQSSMRYVGDSCAKFYGVVRADFGGGFASVRASSLQIDGDRYTGVSLRVLGDGKRYKVRLLNTEAVDPPVFECAFLPATGEWSELLIPFGELIAVRRGQRLNPQPLFDPHSIAAIGLLISDKQFGEFSLLIDQISLY
jgi:NADH dehydrogenase [ubiquinone] 1 alpha subcomplex assembly factor 1